MPSGEPRRAKLLTFEVEPRGIGIPYVKFEAMLKFLDIATVLRYPARCCHPSEVLTFGTGPAAPKTPTATRTSGYVA